MKVECKGGLSGVSPGDARDKKPLCLGKAEEVQGKLSVKEARAAYPLEMPATSNPFAGRVTTKNQEVPSY